MKHVAACSFGKDSIATVILAREHNEPLDEVIYCEVMFDDEISGEVPEHRQFIYEVAKPLFESWGIKVTILRSEKNVHIKLYARNKERQTGGKNSGVSSLWTMHNSTRLQIAAD